VVGALVPIALFSVFVQGPTLRRADTLFDAGNRVNRAAVSFRHEAVGDGATALDSLLGAAERVDTARRGDDSLRTGVSRWLVEHLAGVRLVRGVSRTGATSSPACLRRPSRRSTTGCASC